MSEQQRITDSPEQAKVVNAPVSDDLLVVAGAGSGKTYTMTRRIIELIGRGVPPERILGLTFTRKAAAELLSRVSDAVVKREDTATGVTTGVTTGAAAVRAANRAFLKPTVATYDAFFQGIVRQYGLLVGFDQNTQPLSEAGARQLVSVVIDQHMDLLMNEDYTSFSDVINNVLELSQAIGSAMIGGPVATVSEAIARIRAWDADFIAQLDIAIGETPVPAEQPKPRAPKRLKKDTDRSFEEKRQIYRDELHQVCVWRCDQLRQVTRRRETLLTLVEAYEREKRRQNMAEFSDFTVAAYQLVSRFPSIAQRYRRRYTHVLLDEYQDTSTTQAMLLAALFHPEQVAEQVDNDRTTGNDRSAVNAVGDPFQSIYAWRGASPGAFRMFQRDFDMPVDVRPYPLSVTRRNSRIVLEAANNLTQPLRVGPRRASSSLMREVEVTPLSPKDNADEGTLGVLGFATFGQEIDAVARFAKQAIAMYGSNNSQADNASSGPHVAVLLRSKTRMADFAQGLEACGLTTCVVGYSALLDRPDVKDVFALLHAASDRADSAALMRLLATPRFDLHADELTALARMADDLDTQYRYRALIEAGLVPAESEETSGLPAAGEGSASAATVSTSAADTAHRSPLADERIRAIVKEYRDKVPHAVFLADLLARKDLRELITRDGSFSSTAAHAIVRAGEAIRRVQRVANHPLTETVTEAVTALGLDIDAIVAQAIAHPNQPIHSTQARSATDAIIALVDTYTQEILEGSNPTLRGFVAWVDSLKQVEEETAAVPDTPADVVLMTIHQSKGLEWDAVAVVGMAAGTFPTNQGGLHIESDERHLGGMEQGRWTAPEYHATVSTWLDDAAAVPAPVRVDAGILPRFPHDAQPGASPEQALAMLDDVEVIDDEIYADMRGKDIGDDMDAVDPDSWYLTQEEEYGTRLLADERRLAYVALTRAKHDALLTYSSYSTTDRDPSELLSRAGRQPRAASPSVFWNEVNDSLCHHDDKVTAALTQHTESETASVETIAAAATIAQTPAAPTSLDAVGAARPSGFFVGEHAAQYEQAVVEAAWRSPIEVRDEHVDLTWPAELSDTVRAQLMPAALANAVASGEFAAADGDSVDNGSVDGSLTKSDSANDSSADSAHHSLLARAAMLVADPDLMPWSFDDDASLDEIVHNKAGILLARGRQNVTAMQARAGHMTTSEAREYWRGIIRPIPRVASPAAEAGTIFHAWAEQFINAYGDPIPASDGTATDSETGTTAIATDASQSRAAMLADLTTREKRIVNQLEQQLGESPSSEDSSAKNSQPAKERQLITWQRRLAQSTWANRRPAWAERQIVAVIPGLNNTIVNGKLDAVFHGGINPADTTKRYTIVDWKTGRRPHKPQDIERKLVQLDWYRLLLATIEHVPLDSIDATLYYLSEPEEGARELHASAKTEQEILAELSSGIPEQSDND
ncbi:UvrD/REP helicase [Bifidobacterium goeldii]|uniref:DNA 3'-5' helicase n=1 Tax=Bifidobacterium goeldii TaxID=2306975 RepID=A0A430FL30_9BIFI|nr:ATP-dependent DNA helicase [Bifidobacterium goeldii]RSX53418.1 UvrD/REP helicase [Bifidobacterium goeldii]